MTQPKEPQAQQAGAQLLSLSLAFIRNQLPPSSEFEKQENLIYCSNKERQPLRYSSNSIQEKTKSSLCRTVSGIFLHNATLPEQNHRTLVYLQSRHTL
jgi:hypothetical protein